MFKSDLPPSYEESRHEQLRGGSYPYMPYGYPPQAGTYPGAGQSGLWHGSAYPPPGTPSAIPTFFSSTVSPSATGDTGDGAGDGLWDSRGVRHAFIRKVYLILAAQLLVTTAVVAVFTFVDPVREFVIKYPGIYWASFGVYFVAYMVLVCCEGPRRRFPWNFILLFIFTLALSYMTGTIASYFDTKAVFLALGITAVVCAIVTLFCFQTKVDFTSCTGLFCVLAMVVLVTGIIASIVLSFQYVPWLHMLYAAIGAIVYTLFLAYDTQLLLGNRTLSLSPEEYVFGALSLYVDIVQIFIFLLQITGSSSD
ncbi:protein lifeguard 3 [Brachyhypopomus gauderio]|uniref:protein lifeguard 3 n=1 Tax=Brachyhypopomus gauderio TaxID=698409 RepID=UPI004041D51A